ncbi:MAG TPA: DUF2382 domain-containing protein, partial [Chitinophagaceae bacterium]
MKNFIDSEIKDSSIPIVEENVHIDKKIIEKGKVIISKSIKEESEIINLPVANEEVTIERVSINQILDKPPEAIRYEGNTVIVPV